MLAQIEAMAGGPEPIRERREGARQRLMLRVAKLRCLGGEYACIIHDVSETGAKLRMFHDHPPETFMFLELSNGELYAIERRWTDGDYAGFRFSSAVEVDEFVNEPTPKGRRPIRLRVKHPATVVASGVRGPAMLMDLSSQGACIEAGRQFAVGMPIRIEIPGIPSRFAHVCWRRDYLHGLAFQEAIALKDFARLALDLQPYDPAQAIEAVSQDPPRALRA